MRISIVYPVASNRAILPASECRAQRAALLRSRMHWDRMLEASEEPCPASALINKPGHRVF